jgi:hypothetical protein
VSVLLRILPEFPQITKQENKMRSDAKFAEKQPAQWAKELTDRQIHCKDCPCRRKTKMLFSPSGKRLLSCKIGGCENGEAKERLREETERLKKIDAEIAKFKRNKTHKVATKSNNIFRKLLKILLKIIAGKPKSIISFLSGLFHIPSVFLNESKVTKNI